MSAHTPSPRYSVVRTWANWDAVHSEIVLTALPEAVARRFARAKFNAQRLPSCAYLAVPVGSEPVAFRSLGRSERDV